MVWKVKNCPLNDRISCMSKLLGIIGSIIALVGIASPTYAAEPTVYIDPTNAEGYPLQEVAEDWSLRTGVTVIVAPCTGDNCIHIVTVDTPCADDSIIIGFRGGCAQGSADPGACEIQLNDDLLYRDDPYYTTTLALYVTKHEVGHCIYWFGGAGFIHLDSTRAVMSDGSDGFPTEHQIRLTSEDRKFAQDLTW